MMDARTPDPHQDLFSEPLPCYGCAHAASSAPMPGKPSGERPCCSCVRNPEREAWMKDHTQTASGLRTLDDAIKIDDEGHARVFDPFRGTMYNGAPLIYYPSDNYVTLTFRAQQEWLDENPEYQQAVRILGGGHGPIEVVR